MHPILHCVQVLVGYSWHSDRDGRVEYSLCDAECERVVHVLWECFACI